MFEGHLDMMPIASDYQGTPHHYLLVLNDIFPDSIEQLTLVRGDGWMHPSRRTLPHSELTVHGLDEICRLRRLLVVRSNLTGECEAELDKAGVEIQQKDQWMPDFVQHWKDDPPLRAF